jgi:hypothetical protein
MREFQRKVQKMTTKYCECSDIFLELNNFYKISLVARKRCKILKVIKLGKLYTEIQCFNPLALIQLELPLFLP